VFETILRVFRLGGGELTDGMALTADAAPRINGESVVVSDWLVFFREPSSIRQVTTRVSADANGVRGDGSSGGTTNLIEGSVAISADGRFVAFQSTATTLTSDAGDGPHVFVKALASAAFERVDVGTDQFDYTLAANVRPS
jgi:hypothetical protein